jgi:serine hydrolase
MGLSMRNSKAIFIPGNGGGTPRDSWFPYLQRELEKIGITVIAEDFPDNDLARSGYWLPFIKKLGADENTILIGHSSGAVAAMRFAENNKILGSVLVSACYTDLGDDKEKKSGYYDNSWIWEKIQENQKWIIQYASTDDPWIPIEEARFIHKKLKSEYFEYPDQGHFGYPIEKETFPEIISEIKKKLDLK